MSSWSCWLLLWLFSLVSHEFENQILGANIPLLSGSWTRGGGPALSRSVFHDPFAICWGSQQNRFPWSQRPSHTPRHVWNLVVKSNAYRKDLALTFPLSWFPRCSDAGNALELVRRTRGELTGPEKGREWKCCCRTQWPAWQGMQLPAESLFSTWPHRPLLPAWKGHLGFCHRPPKTFAEPKQDVCCRTEQDIIAFDFCIF